MTEVKTMSIDFKKLAEGYSVGKEVISVADFFTKAKKDKSLYASPYERLLKAIGKPKIVETADDPRLSRIFSNKPLKIYEPFKEFFGMEEVISKIVSYLEHAAQGLEESRQVLYLLGPVGGGKSSLADTLKQLMEKEPFYAIKGSPINESPLALINVFPSLNDDLKIPKHLLPACPSPWLVKRIEEAKGDISKLEVIKLYPSRNLQIGMSKTEPGDENNQDVSALVGKLDIRKLEHFAQDDPDAYKYNGGLCLGNRGIMEFVEMFKAPLKVLNPLLEATQSGSYSGTEQISQIPFNGIILSHSNESEWESFRNNQQNEAFLDRIYIVKVPYNLRYKEEQCIYKKYIGNSTLHNAPIAPHTFDILSKFAILTRLEPVPGEQLEPKLMVYNGDNVKEKFASVKSLLEYKERATLAEGFSGLSTRTAFKLLSGTYNYDMHEKAANPVHLMALIDEYIDKEDLPKEKKELWHSFLRDYLIKEYVAKIRKDIQVAYLDSYSEYGQHLFDRYIEYADAWLDDNNFRDPDTGQVLSRSDLDDFLSEIEKPAGIANPKDFRYEVVHANLRFKAENNGKNIKWTANEKIREVLEKKLFNKIDDILPQISFEKTSNEDDAKKQKNFIKRMTEKGYTERQVRIIVMYYQKYSKSK